MDIRDSGGQFLAWAAFSPHSQISARAWSFAEDERIDDQFFYERFERALARRKELSALDALRLVHGESDGLPGVTADRYGDVVVVQLASAGADAWREMLAYSAFELTGAKCVFERSDIEVRKLEGLPLKVRALRGAVPNLPIAIAENGLRFLVDIERGHKTGFYLDQRENRAAIAALARSRDVLDCFSYSGGFSVSALAGGAESVTAIDSSADALELARQNLAAIGLGEEKSQLVEGDVFQVLRRFRDENRRFDLIILDPPKFAPTAVLVNKAARAYKDINLLAFKLLKPDGLLATFSCSGAVSRELLQKIVAGAALDAGVSARVLDSFHAAPDHPVALSFPEGEYLKGLLCQIDGARPVSRMRRQGP